MTKKQNLLLVAMTYKGYAKDADEQAREAIKAAKYWRKKARELEEKSEQQA